MRHQIQGIVKNSQGIQQTETRGRQMSETHAADESRRRNRRRTHGMRHRHRRTQRTGLARTVHLVVIVGCWVVVVGRRRGRLDGNSGRTGRRVATVITSRVHSGSVHHHRDAKLQSLNASVHQLESYCWKQTTSQPKQTVGEMMS